jgi:hypothetical protein
MYQPLNAATHVSFGITSTPKLGWDCCNTPPCACCKRPVYFSDNHKTWGAEGELIVPACYNPYTDICGSVRILNARVSQGGPTYEYEFRRPCCEDHFISVKRSGIEVGRLTEFLYCCPCDKMAINAVDGTGKSHFSMWYPGCTSCRLFCGGSGGCRGCDMWRSVDDLWVTGPVGSQVEKVPVAVMRSQFHACCRGFSRWWRGFVSSPAASDDERALLLAFAFSNFGNWHRPVISHTPATLGVGASDTSML